MQVTSTEVRLVTQAPDIEGYGYIRVGHVGRGSLAEDSNKVTLTEGGC